MRHWNKLTLLSASVYSTLEYYKLAVLITNFVMYTIIVDIPSNWNIISTGLHRIKIKFRMSTA